MKELILKLSIDEAHGFPWFRTLKNNNLKISKEEIVSTLRDLNLNSFELRKEISYIVALLVYESASNYSNLNDVKKNIKTKFKSFKRLYPYVSDELINHILNMRNLDEEEKIDLFQRTLKNNLSDQEKKNNNNLIEPWLIEIVSYNIMLGEVKNFEDIEEEVFNYLDSRYKYLNIERKKLDSSLKRLGIGLGKNIQVFKMIMKKYKPRFESLLIKKDTQEIKDELTDSILGIIKEAEEKEEYETIKQNNKSEFKKDKSTNLETDIKNREIPINNTDKQEKENTHFEKCNNNEEVYKNMMALAKSLGYELLDSTKMQISKQYYERINSHECEDEKIIKQLLSLEKGCVLSQLYNTYKNLNNTSLDNIEAVMSNFFSTLFDMGFEVNEDEVEIGESITVNTKKLFKEFLFSKPVNKDGEINGQVKCLSWNYKGKMIMPKIVKPME